MGALGRNFDTGLLPLNAVFIDTLDVLGAVSDLATIRSCNSVLNGVFTASVLNMAGALNSVSTTGLFNTTDGQGK